VEPTEALAAGDYGAGVNRRRTGSMTAAQDKKQAEFADVYAQLLNEARDRLNSIPVIRRELAPWVPAHVIDESAYLQLRIICELITIGCLVAHGDISATRVGKLLSANRPTVIMPEMGKLHPHFYPVPFNMDGETYTELKSGFLTQSDLLDLYGECGDALHRGTLKKVLRGDSKTPRFDGIMKWVDLTIRLLVQHNIRLANPAAMLQFKVGPKNTIWGVFREITREEYQAMKDLGPSERLSRLRHIRRPK
jgi:hypothetical protein